MVEKNLTKKEQLEIKNLISKIYKELEKYFNHKVGSSYGLEILDDDLPAEETDRGYYTGVTEDYIFRVCVKG